MGALAVLPIHSGPETPVTFARRFTEGHPGIDIFAPKGAKVVAVADGRIRQAKEKKGGNAVYLVEPDGTQYFYGHLDGFTAPRMSSGQTRSIKAGEALGAVGTTGSAQGTPPHVHFEMRPSGGAKVDPYPALLALAGNVKDSYPVDVIEPKTPISTGSDEEDDSKSGSYLGIIGALLVGGALLALKRSK